MRQLSCVFTLLLALLSLSGCEIFAFEGCEEVTAIPVAEVRIEAGFGGEALDIQPTADGGYIIAGFAASEPYAGDYTYDSNFFGSFDILLTKTDGDGNVQWSNTYGGDDYDLGESVQQTPDGGYVVTGLSEAGSGRDAYSRLVLIKTDSTGNELWQAFYGADVGAAGHGLCVLNDGSVAVAGMTATGYSDFGEAILVKFDAEGNFLWDTVVSEAAFSWANDVTTTQDGGFALAGSQSRILDRVFGNHTVDAFVVKTNGTGDKVWEATYGPPQIRGYYVGNAIVETRDRGLVLAGTAGVEMLVAKMDLNGNPAWEARRKGYPFARAHDVVEGADSSIVVAGVSYYEFIAGLRQCNDYYVVRYGPDGIERWAERYGDGENDTAYAVAPTADGNFVIAGGDRDPTYQIEGGGNVYLITTDAGGEADR